MKTATKKILIIDDEQDVVAMARDCLTAGGHLVDVTYNGKEGLDKLRDAAETKLYDLIILEILVPSLNGIEVCEEMCRDETLRHVPVLMTSILPLESKEFKRSRDTKPELVVVKGVLQKPFTPDQLLNAVGMIQ